MAHIASVSQTELIERRQQLKRQRRQRRLQTCWRTLTLTGLAGGLVWGITLPNWMIVNPDQIAIDGNQLLSENAIRALLPIDYPQSLLQLQPQAIAAQLEAQAPIAKVHVVRHILPPGVTVQVEERQPVAIALPAPNASASHQIAANHSPSPDSEIGLLDENGIWIPMESYTSLDGLPNLPSLKIVGVHEQYRVHWPMLYQQVIQSPVKVFEIDWRQSGNLILKTELGTIHLGPYSGRLATQLQTLDQMRHLSEHLDVSQVAYINLKNPQSPSVQMIQGSQTAKPDTP